MHNKANYKHQIDNVYEIWDLEKDQLLIVMKKGGIVTYALLMAALFNCIMCKKYEIELEESDEVNIRVKKTSKSNFTEAEDIDRVVSENPTICIFYTTFLLIENSWMLWDPNKVPKRSLLLRWVVFCKIPLKNVQIGLFLEMMPTVLDKGTVHHSMDVKKRYSK